MNSKNKVLIVDDETDFLNEITEVLRNAGYEVTALGGGTEALEVAPREKPDVILLDLKMNRGSGFKTATELKRLNETAKTPLIAMTGIYTEDEHRFPIKACGFERCLIKPINPLEVIASIEAVLRGKSESERVGNA